MTTQTQGTDRPTILDILLAAILVAAFAVVAGVGLWSGVIG